MCVNLRIGSIARLISELTTQISELDWFRREPIADWDRPDCPSGGIPRRAHARRMLRKLHITHSFSERIINVQSSKTTRPRTSIPSLPAETQV